MYAELLAGLADDLEAGGPTAALLTGHEDDPGPSGLALRLAGSIHRLVLAGQAAELRGLYPTVGGAWQTTGVGAVVEFLARRRADVRPLLTHAPQTNEVGRAAALVGGLLVLTDRWRLPVRLFEIGASGGLNLQADRFRFTLAPEDQDNEPGGPGGGVEGEWGDSAAPVVLRDAWGGARLPDGVPVEIQERGGSDLHPVDPTSEEGRLTLTSYVWPDMADRHARLAGAIELARRHPVAVQTADAATYVDGLRLVPGTLTVLWHSVMWQYVPDRQRARVSARLAELGASASASAPLVHLFAEPVRRTPESPHEFWVCAETWPGSAHGRGRGEPGERAYLGTMAAHGIPVMWERGLW